MDAADVHASPDDDAGHEVEHGRADGRGTHREHAGEADAGDREADAAMPVE